MAGLWLSVLVRAIGLTALSAALAYGFGLQLSGFAAILSASLGTSAAILATWYDYRPPPAFVWVRLAAGFLVLGLNFSAIIIVFRGSRFEAARLLFPAALFANTFVAGLVFGAATMELIASWHRRRQGARGTSLPRPDD